MKLPYVYIPPDGTMSPLVVSVPHAGTRIPAEDEALIVADQRTMLRDADLHVDKLYSKAAELGAAYLGCTVSRYVLDVNRAPDDVDARLCPEWPNGGSNSKSLIWRLSTDGTEVQGRRLTKAEVDSRIERVHVPYHAKLKALLDERRARFGYAVLLEAHSMPSVGRSEHSDTGERRADVVPGDNHGKACAPGLTQLVVDHFKSHDFGIVLNKPYSGGWNTRHYGQPAEGVHAIQVELNRGLYLHEEVPYWAGGPALELQRVCTELMVKLLDWRP